MRKLALALLVCIFAFIVICGLIVPIVGTCLVNGKTGISDSGGEMKIDALVPWPSKNLWCYEGTWIHDDEVIEFGGKKMTLGNRSFHGYCYVWEMSVQ